MIRLKLRQVPPPLPLSLIVLSGLHEGAIQTISATGTLRIGGGGAADLMLADDGLEAVHAEISFAGGLATLKALHGGVTLIGPGVIPAGKNAVAPLPAEFTVGGVRLRCNGPPPPRRTPWRPIALGALSIVGVFLTVPSRVSALSIAGATRLATNRVLGVQLAKPSETAPSETAPSEIAPSGIAPSEIAPPRPSPRAALSAGSAIVPPASEARARPITGETAAAFLKQAAQDAGLTAITITARGATVLATGTLLPAAGPRWQAVRESFDRRTSGRVVLANEVLVRAEQPFVLAIDSVWTGNYPNIVIGGAKYLEGGVLPNGWTIDRIEAGKLSLHRGGAHTVVAY